MIEVVGDLDSHAVEELYLEIRHLAQRRGVEIGELRIELAAEKRSG